MSNITVLCADGVIHRSLRKAMDECDGILLMETEGGGESLILQQARDLRPDVFLMSGPLDAPHSLSLLARLKVLSPETRIIVFLDFCSHREIIDALSHGIKGCIKKTSPAMEWPKAIRVVHEGNYWIPRQLLVESLDWILNNSGNDGQLPDSKPKILTAREWEVIHWVKQGMTNKEIARQLAISDTTVKTHLQHIYGKLEIRRRLRLPLA